MKKAIAILFLGTMLAFNVNAQDDKAYQKGTSYIHASIGFAPLLGFSFSGLGYTTKTTLPISGGFEYGISDRISVGLMGGYSSQKFTDEDGFGEKYSYLLIGARGSYHFATSEKFDPYFGVLIGYNKISTSVVGQDVDIFGLSAKASGIWPGGFLGANYYFTPNIGAHAEVGYSVSAVTLGLTVKF